MNARTQMLPPGLDAPHGLPETTRCGSVVVLGGGGFVGSAIIAALADAGLPAISAQHHASPTGSFITQRICDATKPAEICELLQGASWVVNAVGGDRRTMLAATHAMAAAANGWSRMLHISSMAVYGDARGYVSETAPLRPVSRYGAAKLACETALAGTGATILRPGLVYGPGSVQWVGRIGRLLRAKRLGDLGKHGDGRCNLVHARDLGRAVVAAIRSRDSQGLTLNIGMTAPPRWNDFLVAFGRSIGAVPVARIAGWRLAFEAGLVGPPLHLAQGFLAPPSRMPETISPALLKLFSHDLVLDCTRAHRLLGAPRISVADGLAQSAAWFLETYGLDDG